MNAFLRTGLWLGGAVLTAGAAGAGWAAYNLLNSQAAEARVVIPHRTDNAPDGDGVYRPDGTSARFTRDTVYDLYLVVFGDSTAAGLGAETADETPGVQIARRVAAETDRVVRYANKAIVGATSKGLGAQIDAMLIAGHRPDVAVILVGANDFVRALSSIGAGLGMRVTVVDARPVFATPERFPDAHEVVVSWPDRYLAEQIRDGLVGPSTAVCVMTHDPKFDVPTLQVALGCRQLGFVGALGSRRTVADRDQRLREAGVDDVRLDRLRSPLGLDLGGHTPGEVAVAIAAQLIAERHGATGAPLHAGDGPIHRR